MSDERWAEFIEAIRKRAYQAFLCAGDHDSNIQASAVCDAIEIIAQELEAAIRNASQ